MDKDKRITAIVLDKEADRKSKIIAEFTGKTLSAIYREALDVYFEQFMEKELWPEIDMYLVNIHWKYNIPIPDKNSALKLGRFNDVAILIAEAVKQLPQEPEAQKLIDEGMRLISILSK